MARTLDAILAAAQDGQSHHPIVEVISRQRVADIPFDGSFLTSETFNEYGANLIPHSSGRLIIAYIYHSGTTSGIKFVYTDTDRTVFTTVDLPLYIYTTSEIKAVSICEMTGGNIGMVLLVDDKSNHLYRLTRRIYTVTGTAVSNAEIANWSHDTFTSDPWVQTIGENSYLIVYGKSSGSDYYLYGRTSADFTTWSAEGALSIGGLTSTWRLANPSIIKISTGDLWLWFDALESTGPGGEELTNIYYSVSADGGGTWADAVKVSAYDSYGEVGSHPVAVQKAANQMNLIFTRTVGALHMDDSATGWPTGDSAVELSWDSANRKLYAINCYAGAGNKPLQCVVKIDVDTWTVDRYWDGTTTPGFPAFITVDGCNASPSGIRVHDGHLIAITSVQSDERFLWVLDGEANTIRNYYFDTSAPLGVTQNVSHPFPKGGLDFNTIREAFVDAANNRVWLLFADGSILGGYHVSVGYIDLTETTDYEYHEVVYATLPTYGDMALPPSMKGGMHVDLSGNMIVVTGGGYYHPIAEIVGWCGVWDIESGALIVMWEGGVDSDFPRYGLTKPFVYNGRIYAGMSEYTSGHGQSAFRGLAEIDVSAETVTLHRPSYCSEDDHAFGRPALLQDGKIAMTHTSFGVAVFDTVSRTWQLYSNGNLSGMTVSGNDHFGPSEIVYDDANDMVMVGYPGIYGTEDPAGVIMFSVNGYIRQAMHSIGTDPGGGWTFATAAQLVQGYLDYDAVAAVEPGSSTAMYVFWTNENTSEEQSIKWDKDGSSLDLSGYLVAGTEIAFERSIDGKPASLRFTVSNGHLFDPYNLASLLNATLRKGRKLTLRFGEKVSGTNYWENQGTFYVTGTSLRFRRGDYPVMEVDAEDGRALWQHSHIIATDIYNNLGEDILEDLMLDVANLSAGDINFPSMGGSAIQMQWIDTTLDEIVTQICNRLGYFFRFDMDAKATARRITNAGSIDHTYTGNADLIEYSPDDKYSDFTNRITVIGQELDFTDVTFDEERITQISGTLGWWGCKAEHVVWFSEDKSRRCVNPRINVIESAVSIPFQLQGSVTETLTECSTSDDNKFCTVNVSAPNLVPQLTSAIAMVAASLGIGDGIPGPAGMTIPIGKILEKAGLVWALMILGSVANYQIEVWAQPLGSVRRSVQGTWDDEEHQTEIGAIVPQVITDPLCYSQADCIEVANFEGMVVQMQRRRVSITKVAHLQDEEGDTIRRVHPYSNQIIDLFVARLRRSMVIPPPGEDGGQFIDEIEGWVVS
ncbi:MAG: hypothetical protein A4E73_02418 [Syntrophaceae bacterium PtaU1.Bin231]|nr:MAG: hypothetical protein A4E73_02418 [Syntrophaceae bacterium PtaU1.Bin231]